MDNVNSLIGTGRGDVQEQLRQLRALLPLARHLPHRPVHAQPRRARQLAAERRLQPLPGAARKQQPRRLASPRRLLHRDDRQVPERLLEQPAVPPGWSEWRAAAPDAQRVYDYTLNENGTLVYYGTDPADFKQDVLTRKAVGLVNRRAPQRAAVLPLAHLHGSPRRRARTRTRTRPSTATAPRSRRRATPMRSTPSRCRGRPNFNEADVSDKPAEIRNRPRLGRGVRSRTSSASTAAELESSSRWTRASRRSSMRWPPEGELGNTLLDVHLGQRLLPRRAPDPRRQDAHLRGVDPGAAPDARAGDPAGGERRRPGDQRRPGPDDRRRRRTRAPAW